MCFCRNYSMNDLKQKFKHHNINATLQCAGNRRTEMNKFEPVKGLQWNGGAIGNASWSGVRMRDLLIADNIIDQENFYYEDYVGHVKMKGYDKDSNTSIF